MDVHGRARSARKGRCGRDESCTEALGKPCQGAVSAVQRHATSEGAEVERLRASLSGERPSCMPTMPALAAAN